MRGSSSLLFSLKLLSLNLWAKLRRLLANFALFIYSVYIKTKELDPKYIKKCLAEASKRCMNWLKSACQNLLDTSWRISKSTLKQRLFYVFSGFLLLYFCIIIQLFNITYKFRNNHELLTGLKQAHTSTARKEIIDKNGYILASNLSTASLYANPKLIWDVSEAAAGLREALPDLSEEELRSKLSNTRRSFCWVKRNLTPKEQAKIHNLGIPGLYFEEESKRVYTHGKMLSHVLGYVDVDGIGKAGIEKYYEDFLNPNSTLSNNKDLLTMLINSSESEKDSNEDKLQLSIDIKAQNILYEELNSAMEEFSALGAMGVIADAETGEIIAMNSLPEFDPHKPGKADDNELFNRASLGSYELGSIMKVLTMAIGLDSGSISLKDAYNIDKPITISGFTIKDYHQKFGWKTTPEIFMHSSNIGIAKMAIEIGKQAQKNYFEELGLFEPVEIEIPEKSRPIYPKDNKWGSLSTITMSYGHGISLSPLHMVKATLPVVNGGWSHNLSLIKQDNSKEAKRPGSKKIFSKVTSEQVNKLLRLTVSKGTGRKAQVPGYLVGGKTGTANKTTSGKYNKNNRISSFISAFPMNQPKYVIMVMLDEPKGTEKTFGLATAGFTAAPIVAKITRRFGTLYGIEPLDENAPQIKSKLSLEYTIDEY